jgi:hypothetical protein
VRDDHGFPLVTATVEIVERTPLGKRITADIALIPATA